MGSGLRFCDTLRKLQNRTPDPALSASPARDPPRRSEGSSRKREESPRRFEELLRRCKELLRRFEELLRSREELLRSRKELLRSRDESLRSRGEFPRRCGGSSPVYAESSKGSFASSPGREGPPPTRGLAPKLTIEGRIGVRLAILRNCKKIAESQA